MTDYSGFTDEVLCAMSSVGDIDAEEELVKKYNYLVRACTRPYFLIGADPEDLIQEGMFGLLSAVRQFSPERDAQFKTYAELCIRRRIYSAIKSASRSKHIPLNDRVSLESSLFDEGALPVPESLRDPEELVIEQEQVDELTLKLKESLSKLEADILDLYLQGLSYGDIAVKAGKSQKSVDNAIQRIRRKLAHLLS